MKKLSHRRTADFCRGLALQLHAGVTLADAVFLLAQEDDSFGKEYQTLGEELDRGGDFAEALAHSGIFPGYVCRMAAVGSRTGRLEETLDSLAEHYETRHETARAIRNALSYPAMVFVLMLIVVGVLLIKVLPIFDQVYASLGSRLTGVSGWLLYLGQGLKAALPVLLTILAVLAFLLILYAKWDTLRERVGGWFAARFGDKGIAKSFHDAYAAQAVAMGLASGLPVEEAVELAGELLSDIPAARARCGLCSVGLAEGKPLAQAMADANFLSPAESRLLAVGIRGGNSDAVMAQVARRLSQRSWEKLEDAVRRIEPMLVLVSSLLVGVILLSVMLPLMDIMSTIG